MAQSIRANVVGSIRAAERGSFDSFALCTGARGRGGTHRQGDWWTRGVVCVAAALVVGGCASGGDAAPPSIPSTSTPTSITHARSTLLPTTAPVPTLSVPSASGGGGPWYQVAIEGASAGAVETVRGPTGTVTVWLSDDGSYAQVLVGRVLSASEQTGLVGTRDQAIQPVSGVLQLLASPDDVPDSEVDTLVGNEMRWRRETGTTLEFASDGFEPTSLVKAVLGLGDGVEGGCPCESPGLSEAPPVSDTPDTRTQTITTPDGQLLLWRTNGSPGVLPIVAQVASWTTRAMQTVDGLDAIVVDSRWALWQNNGYWFSIESLGGGPIDAVLQAIRSARRKGSPQDHYAVETLDQSTATESIAAVVAQWAEHDNVQLRTPTRRIRARNPSASKSTCDRLTDRASRAQQLQLR